MPKNLRRQTRFWYPEPKTPAILNLPVDIVAVGGALRRVVRLVVVVKHWFTIYPATRSMKEDSVHDEGQSRAVDGVHDCKVFIANEALEEAEGSFELTELDGSDIKHVLDTIPY